MPGTTTNPSSATSAFEIDYNDMQLHPSFNLPEHPLAFDAVSNIDTQSVSILESPLYTTP
jgi:hypothetical protein